MQTTHQPLPPSNSPVSTMQLPEVPASPSGRSSSLSPKMATTLVSVVFNLFIITQIICHSSNAQQLNILISNASAAEVAQQFAKSQPAVNFSASNPLDLEPIIQTIPSVNEEVKPAAGGSQEGTEPASFSKTDETTTKNNTELATVSSNDNNTPFNKQLKKQQSEPAAEDNIYNNGRAFHETNDLMEYDDIGDVHLKTSHIKNRRQADNYLDSGNDWWTRLMNKPTTEVPKVERVLRRNSATREPESYSGNEEQPYKRVVYQEQPVSRNPILVVKNQLATIESQRKLLISRSIKQLYQLDTRLIDSYKTYMKKKQPLYAGMLYSTRGFVIKMAKEVKQSKNVLDSMSKQVQGVLKQKMANRTLVKEYNKLTEGSGDAGLPVDESSRSLSPEPITSGFRAGRAFSGGSYPGANEVYQVPRKMRIRYTISVHEVNLKKQLAKIQSLVDRINGSTYELNMVINDINYLFKIAVREAPKKVIPQPPVKEPPPVKESAIKTTKFIQELDKHSPSTYNSKLARKSVKSPIKIFMEKYGKLKSSDSNVNATSSSSSAELVESSRSNFDNLYTPELPEMQPLFDASSFVYTEPKDLTDYGFDSTTSNGSANGGTGN